MSTTKASLPRPAWATGCEDHTLRAGFIAWTRAEALHGIDVDGADVVTVEAIAFDAVTSRPE